MLVYMYIFTPNSTLYKQQTNRSLTDKQTDRQTDKQTNNNQTNKQNRIFTFIFTHPYYLH